MKRTKRVLKILAGVIAFLAIAIWLVFQLPQFGGRIKGTRLERVKSSAEYTGVRFENKPPQNRDMEWLKNVQYYMQGQVREPQFQVPVLPITNEDLRKSPSQELAATWLGHATVIVELNGARFITDPVLSDVVSPLPIGPHRLHPAPIAIADLEGIDGVLVSHDHYDHLDMTTVKKLAEKGSKFFVPLGIGAHLERWGVRVEQIEEMEWWQQAEIKGVKVHCTPARHYSGRKSMDNSTLWSSWLVKSDTQSFYFSGDTGYAPHFIEIKNRLGPVNLTLMKVGAYGDPAGWIDIHMNPESAAQAQLDLQAEVMLPIHWATFNLAYHAWDEPIDRTLAAAKGKPYLVITPRIGERYEYGKPFTNASWYKGQK